MRRLLPPSLLLCVALSPLAAQTVTLSSDEVLRVHFSIASPPSPIPDVLSIMLGIVTVNAPHTTRTAALWSGDELLGVASSSSFGSNVGLLSLSPANSWRETGSPYNFDNPADVMDFSSLQNATIQGIVDFSLATGSFTLDLGNVRLRLIRATGSSGGSLCNVQPTIDEVVVVPKLTGPSPGTVNSLNTWTAAGNGPGNLVAFAIGFSVTPVVLPIAPPVYFDVAPPLSTIITFADPAGTSNIQFFVPAFASGLTLVTQSVEFVGPGIRVSNFVSNTFL